MSINNHKTINAAFENGEVNKSASSPDILIQDVSKTFQSPKQGTTKALENIDLYFPPASVTSIVGASGCGKSTLLRILAGLETEYDGNVLIDGSRVSGPSLEYGIVFQDHRLLPWLTVEKNIDLALHRLSAQARRDVIKEKLELVGLSNFAKALPAQLSGGMAQRVAIARTLAHQPKVLLMDEPFGALDAITRLQLQDELLRIREQLQMTTVLVTHDIEEAIYLGDRVVVLSSRPGKVKAVIDIDLPRPRKRGDSQFAKLKASLYEDFFSHTP